MHDEDLAHPEIPAAEQKAARRSEKKRRRMRVAGKSVFVLGRLLRGSVKNAQRRPRRRKRR